MCIYVCVLLIGRREKGKQHKRYKESRDAWSTEESLYLSPKWNTWLQFAGVFLMPRGCQFRLLYDWTWKVSTHCFLCQSLTGTWWSASGCLLILVTGGQYCLSLIVLPRNRKGLMAYFLSTSLTTENTFMTNRIISALNCDYNHFYLSLKIVCLLLFIHMRWCVYVHAHQHKDRTSCNTIVLFWLGWTLTFPVLSPLHSFH